MENGGTSLVTTEPAAITEFAPTVTPLRITQLAPIHTRSSITVGDPTRGPLPGGLGGEIE